MTKLRTAVFCDFDGTITLRDVGYSIFHHFSGGRNDELLPDWKSGRISSRETLLREAAMSPLTAEQLYAYLDTFEIDEGFAPFVTRCRESGCELIVVSDGLDLYIHHLLGKYNLTDLPLITNHAFLADGHIQIEFPH
ncbi:MAG: HAD-IB family phosphatase, partial [Alphaproteobacteria bacterium]|nr:HAD-IB family phosphatase [Alphaproteobacteria bacterium]